jgi:hypothetical protein
MAIEIYEILRKHFDAETAKTIFKEIEKILDDNSQ